MCIIEAIFILFTPINWPFAYLLCMLNHLLLRYSEAKAI